MGRNASIVADNGAAPGAAGLRVSARDDTAMISVAGSLAASGTAAVGIGADVGTYKKRTDAFIESGVNAAVEGDVQVLADGRQLWHRRIATSNAGSSDSLDYRFSRSVPVGQALRVLARGAVAGVARSRLLIEAEATDDA